MKSEAQIIKGSYGAEEVMRAHQCLYYVFADPIWTDHEYDQFCKRHGLDGKGGSDHADAYSEQVRVLATDMSLRPHRFPPSMTFK